MVRPPVCLDRIGYLDDKSWSMLLSGAETYESILLFLYYDGVYSFIWISLCD